MLFLSFSLSLFHLFKGVFKYTCEDKHVLAQVLIHVYACIRKYIKCIDILIQFLSIVHFDFHNDSLVRVKLTKHTYSHICTHAHTTYTHTFACTHTHHTYVQTHTHTHENTF